MASINSTVTRGLQLGMMMLGFWRAAILNRAPEPRDLQSRLSAFPTRGLPLEGEVETWWNDHQVPFIEAESDADLAFVLGLVHAHLRLGQISTARLIAQGRISEIIGPLGVDLDHLLRILAPGNAAEAIEQNMDDDARQWVRRFVDGINHYQYSTEKLPHDFDMLGIKPEPWSISDVIAIGRLAGLDVNWMTWARLLPLHGRKGWRGLWQQLMDGGQLTFPGPDDHGFKKYLQQMLTGFARSGSNSLAVSGHRTNGRGALIANDPHLGIMVPNLWLIAGVKSPSYHVVGLMGAGLPLFAIGRNPYIAWGGTNLRGASSDLFDVSTIPESKITSHLERIRVRWGRRRGLLIRETTHGRIITDNRLVKSLDLPPLALKWAGHEASDEIGAMLAVSRARDFSEYRTALETFAVPAQNMIYADVDGNIGKVMAAWMPQRDGMPPDIILDPASAYTSWSVIYNAGTLPHDHNPDAGFVVSANNRPSSGDMPVGFFYSPEDRACRMEALLGGDQPCSTGMLRDLQQDVYMASAAAMRDLLVSTIVALGVDKTTDDIGMEVIRRLQNWDCRYTPNSVEAATFEQFRSSFLQCLYTDKHGSTEGNRLAGLHQGTSLVLDEIATADPASLRNAIITGLGVAIDGMDTITDWQDMHRLRLAHPLARIPLVGKRYQYLEAGVGGSSDTVMKTAHAASPGRHTVTYGSNARHISDLSDPDENLFALLGGQDGWFNSSTSLDQWDLWQRGEYVRVPMTPSRVRTTFAHRITLRN